MLRRSKTKCGDQGKVVLVIIRCSAMIRFMHSLVITLTNHKVTSKHIPSPLLNRKALGVRSEIWLMWQSLLWVQLWVTLVGTLFFSQSPTQDHCGTKRDPAS